MTWPQTAWVDPHGGSDIRAINLKVQQIGGPCVALYRDQYWFPAVDELGMTIAYEGREATQTLKAEWGSCKRPPWNSNQLNWLLGPIVHTDEHKEPVPQEVLATVRPWQEGTAKVIFEERMAIVEADDRSFTFSALDLSKNPYELVKDLNAGMKEAGTGVWITRLEPVLHEGPSKHLYHDGRVPRVGNDHTSVNCTGYAFYAPDNYAKIMVYLGVIGYKTSIESIWASAVQAKDKARLYMNNTMIYPEGDIKMVTRGVPRLNAVSAAIVVTKAVPGLWEGGHDCAYVLFFDGRPPTPEEKQAKVIARLQECLAVPILEGWSKVLYGAALAQGFLKDLDVGGDCRGGVRIDLERDWIVLVQELLAQRVISL